MPGSKKGEHRGNARKRPDKPGSALSKSGKQHREFIRSHESPNEIMHEAARRSTEHGHLVPAVVEHRIQISRVINGVSGRAEDVTPKEALLLGMHHNLQAFMDWRDMLVELAKLEPSVENDLAVERAERECERLLDKVRDHARDAAPFIHPKLSATHVTGMQGDNQRSIMVELLEEINELERSVPIPIEHKPRQGSG